MTQEDLLKPYLNLAAETLMWVKHRKPIDLQRLKAALRNALTNEGVHSITLTPAHDELIIAYFDSHQGFERVSAAPEWALPVKSLAR